MQTGRNHRRPSAYGPTGSALFRVLLDFPLLTKCRLCLRITLAVFLSILLIEAVILIPSYLGRERALVAELEAVGLAAMRAALHGEDAASVARLVSDLKEPPQLKPVVGFALYDKSGRFLAHAGDAPDMQPHEAAKRDNGAQDPYRGERHIVVWGGEELLAPFTVVASLDRSTMAADLRAFVLRIAGLTLLIAVVVCAATLVVLAVTVFRPLLNIRDHLLGAASDPKHSDRETPNGE